jgi:hypothetical protein
MKEEPLESLFSDPQKEEKEEERIKSLFSNPQEEEQSKSLFSEAPETQSPASGQPQSLFSGMEFTTSDSDASVSLFAENNDPTVYDYLVDPLVAIPRGLIEGGTVSLPIAIAELSGSLGLVEDPTETLMYKGAKDNQEFINEIFKDIDNTRGTLITDSMYSIGQMIPLLTASFISGNPAPLLAGGSTTAAATGAAVRSVASRALTVYGTTSLVGAQVAGETELARAKGATEEQVGQMAMLQVPIGLLDSFSSMFLVGRSFNVKGLIELSKAGGKSLLAKTKTVAPFFAREYVKGAATEGITESVQGVLSNLTANQVYDTSRGLTDGVLYEGAVGAFTGGLVSSIATYANNKKMLKELTGEEVVNLETIQNIHDTFKGKAGKIVKSENADPIRDARVKVYNIFTGDLGYSHRQAIDYLGVLETFANSNNRTIVDYADSFEAVRANPDQTFSQAFANAFEVSENTEEKTYTIQDKKTGLVSTVPKQNTDLMTSIIAKDRILQTPEGRKLNAKMEEASGDEALAKRDELLKLIAKEEAKVLNEISNPTSLETPTVQFKAPPSMGNFYSVLDDKRFIIPEGRVKEADALKIIGNIVYESLDLGRKGAVNEILKGKLRRITDAKTATNEVKKAVFIKEFIEFMNKGKTINSQLDKIINRISKRMNKRNELAGSPNRTNFGIQMKAIFTPDYKPGDRVMLELALDEPIEAVIVNKYSKSHYSIKPTQNATHKKGNKTLLYKADKDVLVGIDQITPKVLYPIDPINKYSELSGQFKPLKSLYPFLTDIVFQTTRSQNPVLKSIADKIMTGELLSRYMHNEFIDRLQSWKLRLNKSERRTLRNIVEDTYNLPDEELEDKYRTEALSVAREIIDYLDDSRNTYIQHLRTSMLSKLNENMEAAVLELSDWEERGFNALDILSVTRNKHGIKSEIELMEKYRSYKRLLNWGKDNYVPRFEKGTYMVIDNESGATIARRTSRKEARKVAEQIKKDTQRETRVITDKDGGSRNNVDPFATRKDILEGDKDFFNQLADYSYHLTRRTILLPKLREAQQQINESDASLEFPVKDQLTKLVDRVRKGETYLLFRDKSPETRARYQKALLETRKWTATVKFTNVASVLTNLFAGITNLTAKFAPKQLSKGIKFLNTQEGKAWIKEHEWMLGVDLAQEITGKSVLSKYTRKGLRFLNPLVFFQLPEAPMRKIALASAYQMSLEAGMNSEMAAKEAMMVNAVTLFTYNMGNLAVVLSSGETKTLFQFKNYLLKQGEFLWSLDPKQRSRYLAMSALLGGPSIYFSFFKALPLIGYFLGQGTDWLERETRELFGENFYGLFGMLGVDISTGLALDIPEESRDFLGPIAGLIYQLGATIFEAAKTQDALWGTREVSERLIRYIAMGSNILDVMLVNKKGEVIDYQTGVPKYYLGLNWYDQALHIVGFKEIAKADYYKMQEWLYGEKRRTLSAAKSLLKRARTHLRHKTMDERLIFEMKRMGIPAPTVFKRWAAAQALSEKEYRAFQIQSIQTLNDIENRLPNLLFDFPEE